MNKIITILVLVSLAISINAQPSIQWQKCMGGSSYEEAYCIKETNNGGYIVAGYSSSNDSNVTGNHGGTDYWIVKLDITGNIQWQKSLGGSNNDIANSIQQTNDGGFIVAGYTYSNNGNVLGNHDTTGTYSDYWIVKLDTSGIIQWQKCLGGSGDDKAYSIQQTNDSGYVVVGYSFSNAYSNINDGDITVNHGGDDYWVVKLDTVGNIQWQKSLGGSYNDDAYSINQTNDGGYIVAGYSYSNDVYVSGNHGGFDYWIVKIDTIGNIQWQKSLGGSNNDIAYSIQQTIDGGYIVAGYSFSNDIDVSGNHNGSDYWVVKLDTVGNIQWQKSLGGSSNEEAYSIQQTNDSGYIVAGYSISNNGDVTGNHGSYDYWLVKINNIGNIQWQKSLGGTNNESTTYDYGNSIIQTTDGGYVIAGSSQSNDGDVSDNNGNRDYWIVKLETYCSILADSISASSTTICSGSQVTINKYGGLLGTDANWYWYDTACGGNLIGSGNSITQSPTISSSYYVRAEGTCNTTNCVSVTINVNTSSISPSSITCNTLNVCSGVSTTLALIGGNLGTGASWNWHADSCGGTFIMSGDSAIVYPTDTTEYFVRAENLCNTTTCVSITINIIPLPAQAGAISGNINPLSGTSQTYTVANVSGVTYSWTASSGWVGSSSSNSITYIVGITNGVVSVVPNNNCGAGAGSSLIIGSGSYQVSGYFTYNNIAQSPLDSVNVFLLSNGNIIDSTQTDTNGYYQFNNILNGAYNISATTHKAWGGVNVTDVVKIKRHFSGAELLTSSLKLHAGDVNLSYAINVTDAVKILRRYSGADTSFTRGDWVFEKSSGGDTINVSTNINDTIIVTGANVVQDFNGLCVGDVNGSYNSIPSGNKSLARKVKTVKFDFKTEKNVTHKSFFINHFKTQ